VHYSFILKKLTEKKRTIEYFICSYNSRKERFSTSHMKTLYRRISDEQTCTCILGIGLGQQRRPSCARPSENYLALRGRKRPLLSGHS
jgi:hypothetical protein